MITDTRCYRGVSSLTSRIAFPRMSSWEWTAHCHQRQVIKIRNQWKDKKKKKESCANITRMELKAFYDASPLG